MTCQLCSGHFRRICCKVRLLQLACSYSLLGDLKVHFSEVIRLPEVQLSGDFRDSE